MQTVFKKKKFQFEILSFIFQNDYFLNKLYGPVLAPYKTNKFMPFLNICENYD